MRVVSVILSYEEYTALIEKAEDLDDARALTQFVERVRDGSERTVPSSVLDRLLDGEPPVAPLHLPKKHDELDRLLGVGEHALASRETVVHVVQTDLDKHPQVARRPTSRNPNLTQLF